MMDTEHLWDIPRLISHIDDPQLCVIDVREIPHYARGHIPGAVLLQPGQLMSMKPPAMGLLPDTVIMSHVLSVLGINEETTVVAYDDEGGGWASRLLWNLEAYGHHRYALLDGGWPHWKAAKGEVSVIPASRSSVNRILVREGSNVADRNYIISRLGNPDTCLLDCRTEPEFLGLDVRAARGGHIPGAVNIDWVDFMDQHQHLRLKGETELRKMLSDLKITPDKEVITYCQTNHRSALPWLTLKLLGFVRAKGYDGAWSDWGNARDTPIEIG